MAAAGDEVVFELKASEKDRFSGGSVALTGGRTLDFGRRLKAGKGKIATSDGAEIDVLDRVPSLQRAKAKTRVRKAAKAAKASASSGSADSGKKGGDGS